MSSVLGIDNSTGAYPLVIGYSSSFVLMGSLVSQTYNYFNHSSNDPRGLKAFVWILFISELFLTILTVYGFWRGVSASDLLTIFHAGMIVPALAFLTGFVSFITHGFFGWRIWRLKRSCPIPILVMMISSVQFAMVTYGGVQMKQFGLSPSVQLIDMFDSSDDGLPIMDQFEFYIPVWLCGSLLCDTTITIYMTMILRKERKSSSSKSTKTLTTSLLKLTLGTGLITTLAAILELILATVFRDTVWHLALFFIISKLYANCALFNLNARKRFRSRNDAQSLVIMSTFHAVSEPRDIANEHVQAVQVFKQVETDVEREPIDR